MPADDKPFDDREAEFIRIISENGTLDDAAAALKCHRTTLLRWLREDKTGELRNHYARAREDQGDLSADEIKNIARQVLRGEIDPQAGRVAIDALKWDAGKRKPKVYGDKTDVTVTHRNANGLSDDELAHIASGGGTGASEASDDKVKLH